MEEEEGFSDLCLKTFSRRERSNAGMRGNKGKSVLAQRRRGAENAKKSVMIGETRIQKISLRSLRLE